MRRRHFLAGSLAFASGCVTKEALWCEEPLINDDGPWPEDCAATASNIEGPFYLEDAPERDDLDLWDDEGTALEVSGTVFESGCSAGVAGALVEIWHADPDGGYDNTSSDMRYRAVLVSDDEGRYSFRTLVPGAYLNGSSYRPRHIHVKVWIDGVERLTTQLYFEDDEYLDCDEFANTSLVMPLSGSDADGRVAEGIDLVV